MDLLNACHVSGIIYSKHFFCIFYLICTTTLCGRYYDYSHFIKEKILHELSNVPTVIQLESGGASSKFTQST